MQGILDLPRTGLTATQVLYIVARSPAVAYDRGLEVLDASLNVVADISSSFQGGKVSRTMQATVHGTCALKLAVDISYETQLLRPYMLATADGMTARFNLGAYTAHKPKTTFNTTPRSETITGSDRLYLLSRPVGDAYSVGAGVSYLTAAKDAIVASGLPASTILMDSTAAASVLPATRVWPMIATAKASGTTTPTGPTTWLRIVNDLLSAINYRGVWADWNGLFRFTPYVLPATRAPEWTWDWNDERYGIVSSRSITDDIADVPNKWVFVQSNLVNGTGDSIEPTEGAGQYTVVNQATGPTSITRRDGLVLVEVVELDAADQAGLVAQGNARVVADQSVATVLTVTTAPFPLAWHWDVYTYADTIAGGATVESIKWTLDLGTSTTPPADMQHTWQVIP